MLNFKLEKLTVITFLYVTINLTDFLTWTTETELMAELCLANKVATDCIENLKICN